MRKRPSRNRLSFKTRCHASIVFGLVLRERFLLSKSQLAGQSAGRADVPDEDRRHRQPRSAKRQRQPSAVANADHCEIRQRAGDRQSLQLVSRRPKSTAAQLPASAPVRRSRSSTALAETHCPTRWDSNGPNLRISKFSPARICSRSSHFRWRSFSCSWFCPPNTKVGRCRCRSFSSCRCACWRRSPASG